MNANKQYLVPVPVRFQTFCCLQKKIQPQNNILNLNSLSTQPHPTPHPNAASASPASPRTQKRTPRAWGFVTPSRSLWSWALRWRCCVTGPRAQQLPPCSSRRCSPSTDSLTASPRTRAMLSSSEVRARVRVRLRVRVGLALTPNPNT